MTGGHNRLGVRLVLTNGSESLREYFSEDAAVHAASDAFARLVKERLDSIIDQSFSRRNVQYFRHGGVWRHPANAEAFDGGVKQHSAFGETSFEDLISNDLGSLERAVNQLSEAMAAEFMKSLYATVKDSCESVGNVVKARAEVPVYQLMYETLEKIDFCADKNGNVELPQLHLDAKTLEELSKSLAEAPHDFKQRLEDLKARKAEEAQAKEARRKLRFRCYGEQP